MVKLSLEDVKEIKDLHMGIVEDLSTVLESTVEGEVSPIINTNAPMLCRNARRNATHIRRIIDKAEDVAARSGDLEGERAIEAMFASIKAAFPAFGGADLIDAIAWMKAEIERLGEIISTGLLADTETEEIIAENETLKGIIAESRQYVGAAPAENEDAKALFARIDEALGPINTGEVKNVTETASSESTN